MNVRPIDRSKKSNIKCEHCSNWNRRTGECACTHNVTNYWNRCKQFAWMEKTELKKQKD